MKNIGRLPTCAARPSLIRSYPFSASASSSNTSGGRGRGRGSNDHSGPKAFVPNQIGESSDHANQPNLPSTGVGHGSVKPLLSSSILQPFPSWTSDELPPSGRGRSSPPLQHDPSNTQPVKPIFFRREDAQSVSRTSHAPILPPMSGESTLPSSLSSSLGGWGRGNQVRPSEGASVGEEVNRHLRPRRGGPPPDRGRAPMMGWQGGRGEMGRGERGERGRGVRGRGLRGRGRRGAFRGGRERGEWGQRLRREEEEAEISNALFLGDGTNGEKLTKRIGEAGMKLIMDGFDEISLRVLPSPMEEAYLEALHMNNMIEYEPEYLMEDFGINPDIDEKPIIPLRDALEKAKPFLMAYEGIQNQEEWEEIMEEMMGKAPYMEQLIDFYCGPDRVTAKDQIEELESVAQTIPENVPNSVKKFTNRALLSLQSNPGWGFDKKCQFMDKLVWEIKQDYGKKQSIPS